MPTPARILRLSGVLYWLCSALLILAPLVVLAALGYGWAAVEGLPLRFPGLPAATVLTQTKAIAVTVVSCLSLLPMIALVWQMRRLFGRYRGGEILTDACAQHILRIGQALIALALLLLVLPTLQILLLTADNPDGAKVLSIGIDGSMIGLGLAGGLLVVIGWVMREATREIESFV